MRPLPRFVPPLGALALLAACSSATSTPDASPAHDASVDARTARPDARPADVTVPPDVYVPNRMPGQRIPLSAACESIDGTRCLLPWPSNTYTVVDPTTPTGLRVNLSQQSLAAIPDPMPPDVPTSLNRADGFSRVTPVETGFDGVLDKTSLGELTTGSVRLLVEQPGSTFGQAVPLRFDTVASPAIDPTQSILMAYPLVPLAPDTDYAVIVMNSAQFTNGKALTPDRNGQVALGLATPDTAAEGALYAYDAPARAAMKAAGIDPKDAVRIWDFTTRSLAQPTSDLLAMRAVELAAFDSSPVGGDAGIPVAPDAGSAPDAGGSARDGGGGPDGGDGATATGVGLAIDSVSTTPTGTVLLAVLGRITGVPSYLTSTGSLSRDDAGAPLAMGVHDIPFRAAIPVGTGDYRLVMYGHGLGGSYDETSFDQQITANGAVKIGTPFLGWTESTIADTFGLFNRVAAGSEIATAGLTQSLADQMVVQRALAGSLGALLGAPTLAGVTNPAAGRRPNVSQPVWAGGSLGGTMGFVYASAEPAISAAVLNVPGAGWSHFMYYSYIFEIVKDIMAGNYPTPIDIVLGVAESQLNFDPDDGAVWYDAVTTPHPLLLEQESIGDPVLPNIGNDMVATASHAEQVGVVLNPIVTCMDVTEAPAHNGMTQFEVPSSITAPLDIHGFAAGSSPAGVAAQQQIVAFIGSVWAGAPVITIPPECVSNTPANSCDFSNDNDAGP